jgi:hypothetical protein
MSHRRICYCCGCEYFSDKFGRDELGRYWDEVSGNWELAGGGVQTESSNAVLKCLKEHPNQFTTYLVSARVTFTAYGDVAKLIADYDGAQKEGVFKIISDGHGLIETYDNGDLVAWANAGNWRLNEPITINLCLSKTEVRANGIGEAIQNEATSSVVALGTGEVTGTVTFDDVSISKHDDDNPGCAKCRATLPWFCACQDGYPPDEPSHVPAQVTLTMDWSDMLAAQPVGSYMECIWEYFNNETYTLTAGGVGGYGCTYTYTLNRSLAWCGTIRAIYCLLGRRVIEIGGIGTDPVYGGVCMSPWFYSRLDDIDCLNLSLDLVGLTSAEIIAAGGALSSVCPGPRGFTYADDDVEYTTPIRAKCHVEAG